MELSFMPGIHAGPQLYRGNPNEPINSITTTDHYVSCENSRGHHIGRIKFIESSSANSRGRIVYADGKVLEVRESDDRSDLRPVIDADTYDNPQGVNQRQVNPNAIRGHRLLDWLGNGEVYHEIYVDRETDRRQRELALTDPDWRDRWNFEHPNDPLVELGQTADSVRYIARLAKPRRPRDGTEPTTRTRRVRQEFNYAGTSQGGGHQ